MRWRAMYGSVFYAAVQGVLLAGDAAYCRRQGLVGMCVEANRRCWFSL